MQNIAQPKTIKAPPITIARPSLLNRQTMWLAIFVIAVIWALAYAGVQDDFSFVSTAGGAFLEWMEGKPLPGVEALKN